jgi:hypothetical protein
MLLKWADLAFALNLYLLSSFKERQAVSCLYSLRSQVYPDKYICHSELLNCYQNGPFFKWSLSSLIHALSSIEPLNKNPGQNAFEKG